MEGRTIRATSACLRFIMVLGFVEARRTADVPVALLMDREKPGLYLVIRLAYVIN
jgi:hypothetical protein